MVGRAACRLWLYPIKTKHQQIELIYESVDYTNRVFFTDVIFKAGRQQRLLAAIFSFDKSAQSDLPKEQQNANLICQFSHSLRI